MAHCTAIVERVRRPRGADSRVEDLPDFEDRFVTAETLANTGFLFLILSIGVAAGLNFFVLEDRFVTAETLANTGFSFLIFTKLKYGHYFCAHTQYTAPREFRERPHAPEGFSRSERPPPPCSAFIVSAIFGRVFAFRPARLTLRASRVAWPPPNARKAKY